MVLTGSPGSAADVTDLRGRIFFRGHVPAASIALTLWNPELGESAVVFTGSDGWYYFHAIPVGDYELRIKTNERVIRCPVHVGARFMHNIILPTCMGSIEVGGSSSFGADIPATTTTLEPDLAGKVFGDSKTTFEVGPSVNVFCKGEIQHRVIRSARPEGEQVDYFRIQGVGGKGRVTELALSGVAVPGGTLITVGYIADGTGGTPPGNFYWNQDPGTGGTIRFYFGGDGLSCMETSAFFFIKGLGVGLFRLEAQVDARDVDGRALSSVARCLEPVIEGIRC
jgi:hypothetical protein